jgi:hypothetical protein
MGLGGYSLLAHTSLSFFVENEEGIWVWLPVTKSVRFPAWASCVS